MIYKIIDGKERLIYFFGASGQKNTDSTLKVRKGGMYNRLVNGYHPNKLGITQRVNRKA